MMDLVRQMNRGRLMQQEEFDSDDGLDALDMAGQKTITDEELTKQVEGALLPNLAFFKQEEEDKYQGYGKHEEKKGEKLEISDYLDKYKDSEHAIR